jgi:hypothetical protein
MPTYLLILFSLIPEYMYIPYGSQTFLRKKDLGSWKKWVKGQIRKLGCGCGGWAWYRMVWYGGMVGGANI